MFQLRKDQRKPENFLYVSEYIEEMLGGCGGVFSTAEGIPNYSRTIFRSLNYISYKANLIIGVPLSP